MKRRNLILAGVLAAVLVAAGVLAFYLYERPSGLVTVHPYRGVAVEAVYATGTVESVGSIDVAPLVSGHLVEVVKKEGERVAKGDVLARLDDREERARVGELQAKASYYAAEAERRAVLFKQGTIAASARDRAIFERDASRNALEAARARLADHVLRAPIDGIVLRRDGDVGDLVAAGKVIFTVGKLSRLRVTADVDEADILRIAPDQRAVIRADALPDQVLEGKVSEITPLGDPVARSYRVRVVLPQKTKLLAGMTVEVNIIVREDKSALLVPQQALDGRAVWVVRQGRVHRQAIETGTVGNGAAEILDGLGENDVVVLTRPKRLREGMALRNIIAE